MLVQIKSFSFPLACKPFKRILLITRKVFAPSLTYSGLSFLSVTKNFVFFRNRVMKSNRQLCCRWRCQICYRWLYGRFYWSQVSCLHSRLICSTLFVWSFDKIRMNVTSRSQIKKKNRQEKWILLILISFCNYALNFSRKGFCMDLLLSLVYREIIYVKICANLQLVPLSNNCQAN